MDNLIFIELAILIAVTFGWFLGMITPFAIKWMQRVASHAQLKLDDKRHTQKVLRQQTSQPAPKVVPQLQQSMGTP